MSLSHVNWIISLVRRTGVSQRGDNRPLTIEGREWTLTALRERSGEAQVRESRKRKETHLGTWASTHLGWASL